MRPAPDLFGHRRRPDDWRAGVDELAAGVSLDAQISCVRRELKLRREVYGQRVNAGRLDPEHARRELAAMTAVLRTLQRGAG